MTLSVMEGVAFALLDCIEVVRENGLKINGAKICGGGAKSDIWKKIIANVFGVPLLVPSVEEGPAYGAAILAMVGAKEYVSVAEAVQNVVSVKEKVFPMDDLTEKYKKKYAKFKRLYPALKDVF